MKSVSSYMNIVRLAVHLLLKNDERRLLAHTFIYYAIIRLQRLICNRIEWKILPDRNFKRIAKKLGFGLNTYIDYESCILISTRDTKFFLYDWVYVCSKVSMRKYKVQVVPFHDDNKDVILLSETMEYNLKNSLHSAGLQDDCFIVGVKDTSINFAIEAKVALISSPHIDNAHRVIDSLLENYFSEPRYLRKNDIFKIETNEYLPEMLYSPGNSLVSVIYLKVKSIKTNGNENGAYILKGETSLIQESNIHSYLPIKCSYNIFDESLEKILKNISEVSVEKYPDAFSEPLQHLKSCILLFTNQGIRLRIRPMFLLKGEPGSGKRMLIRIISEELGLHLLTVDFGEVQTLTSAQTEAKLRIVLNNAQQCAPCILCLNNIEVFGKNSEGQKDERIISFFTNEINNLCDRNSTYPVIIIATSDGSDIPAELNRMFIRSIHIDHLDQTKRTSLFSWLFKQQQINHTIDLTKLAGMCSDFSFSDMTILVSHALKALHKRIEYDSELSAMLTQDDCDKAYEYMQSTYTDCKGTPRVPKVHWEDIGGLADLKHEIKRRIQLPLLNALGFGQSGLLLYGPPGTGKTLLAKAVATEYQLHFLSIKGPEVLNMYVGQSEKNVRQVFERARAAAPCIIFFDELDSLAPNRGRSGDSGGVMDRIVSQLLAEMDGLDGSSSIFIIGATNRPDLIDPALLRPGRFDKLLYVGIHSDPSSQLSVLKALTRSFCLRDAGAELERLITELPKHTTGADLYGVCSDAWLNAARRFLSDRTHTETSNNDANCEKLSTSIIVGIDDFLEGVRTLVPSVSNEEAERYRRMQMELSSTS